MTSTQPSAVETPAQPLVQPVWAELVGQRAAVEILQRAVSGVDHAMSHAWLITGPPGSGRSNAARAFAAALQCLDAGCGHCQSCRTALSGAHPDVTLVRTELLSIGVDEVRDLVRRAAMSPTMGGRQVLVVEDCDRVTERGADALLKAIEEPAAATVWILCAPTPEDVVPTIRSRCRLLTLTTPQAGDIEQLLITRDGVAPELAEFAARVSQGHIGRAKALVRNEAAHNRRHQILDIPSRLGSLGGCLAAASDIVAHAKEETEDRAVELEAKENAEFERALGFGTKGAKPRQSAAAKKDLEDQQKARRTRMQRDVIDRSLTELTGFYRDVLTIQTQAETALINKEQAALITKVAQASSPELTLRRIDAILACRTAMEGNVAPLLAVEALMMGLAAV